MRRSDAFDVDRTGSGSAVLDPDRVNRCAFAVADEQDVLRPERHRAERLHGGSAHAHAVGTVRRGGGGGDGVESSGGDEKPGVNRKGPRMVLHSV